MYKAGLLSENPMCRGEEEPSWPCIGRKPPGAFSETHSLCFRSPIWSLDHIALETIFLIAQIFPSQPDGKLSEGKDHALK